MTDRGLSATPQHGNDTVAPNPEEARILKEQGLEVKDRQLLRIKPDGTKESIADFDDNTADVEYKKNNKGEAMMKITNKQGPPGYYFLLNGDFHEATKMDYEDKPSSGSSGGFLNMGPGTRYAMLPKLKPKK